MQITHHLDYENIVRGRAELVHLVILFQAAKIASDWSSAFVYGLVLDTSTSMQGEPLEHAKDAAQMVITHLRAEDRIAVVTFSDAARTVVPLQLATDKPGLQGLDGAHAQNEPNINVAFAALELLLHDAATDTSTAERALRGAKGQRLARRGLFMLGWRRSIAGKRAGRRGSG